MSNELVRIVDRFAGIRVLVVGDAMLDRFLQGDATRICREAPVPVVRLASAFDAPGGAANTAVNLRALGADVRLLAVVGDDVPSRRLAAGLSERDVGTDLVIRRRGRRTLVLHRLYASSQLLVRFDEGDGAGLDAAAEAAVVDAVHGLYPGVDAVIVSDYDNGTVTAAVREAVAQAQAAHPRLLVVDARHLAAYRHVGATVVKPNWSEALHLLGTGALDGVSERAEGIAAHGDRILELTGAQVAAVTLDAEGAIVFERGRPPHRTYARPSSNTSAAGAGDTFVATLTLALAAGAHTPAAAELASRAAGVVVDKDGTAACEAAELVGCLGREEKHAPSVAALVARVRAGRGRRVVFTNGCFDILHRGHITFLNRAKTLGDVLVVGVNGDASTRRLKGPGRPINPLEDRVSVLAALSCVDHIVAFDDDTPADVLAALRPDVYVKGGDHTLDTLPEAPLVARLGGQVRILPFMEDRSTAGIIERIRRHDRAAR